MHHASLLVVLRHSTRALVLLPFLASLLLAQSTSELVVSVGHSGEPDRAVFAGRYLITSSWSNVSIIDPSSGLTVAHLPQGSLVMALEPSPSGEMLAVGTCGHAINLWNIWLLCTCSTTVGTGSSLRRMDGSTEA
jgi:hypothetical protein